MKEICTATIKLTNVEIDKIIWCIKSVENVLGAFEIIPDKDFRIKLSELLKSMEKISNDIKKEAEKRATATTKVDPVTVKEQPKEIDDTIGKILPTDDIAFPTAKGSTDLDTPIPKPREDLGQIKEVDKVTDKIGKVERTEGDVTKEIPDIVGELSEGALPVDATQELAEKATVKYKMANLMSDIE